MCTSIKLITSRKNVLAQNYDFYYGHGLIIKNIRGLHKVALTEKLTRDNFFSDENDGAKWISKYGSITFNQFARELPTCGINEAGLAITSMWHEKKDKIKPESKNQITELQWIQMQLDLYSTVKEVAKQIQSVSYGTRVAPMHYFLSDKTGNSIIVEFINNSLKIYDANNIYSCSNTGIEETLKYIGKNKNIIDNSISVKNSALKRALKSFLLSKNVFLNEKIENDFNKIPFKILDEVSLKADFGDLFKWLAKKIPPSQTFWQIVFDISDMKIFIKTKSNNHIREIHINDFDFSKTSKIKVFNIEGGDSNITKLFRDYSRNENKRIVKKSFAPIKKDFPLNEQKELIEYPELFKPS